MLRSAFWTFLWLAGFVAVSWFATQLVPKPLEGRVGVFGTALGVVGLLFTIYQLIATRRAVDAARIAALDAKRRMRVERQRELLIRMIHSLRTCDKCIVRQDWPAASGDAADVSAIAFDLALAAPEFDRVWQELGNFASVWSESFRQFDGQKGTIRTWRALFDRVTDKTLKEYHAILSVIEDEK